MMAANSCVPWKNSLGGNCPLKRNLGIIAFARGGAASLEQNQVCFLRGERKDLVGERGAREHVQSASEHIEKNSGPFLRKQP